MIRSRITIVCAAAVIAFVVATPAMATTGKGSLFHDGAVVGTVVVPADVAPGSGSDPFYTITNGATGQLGIAGVAPGDGPYHGGDWQVWVVTFNNGVTPYLLTSDEAVASAQLAGDVTVTRAPDADFRCPIT
jgi:hypothetical protein